jgi:hypothetical protein
MGKSGWLGKIIYWNAVLVLAGGMYGILTDEPYWRANGHGPNLYDYLFWIGLALNGPSGFAADYISWGLIYPSDSGVDWRFLLQYGLWLLFLALQWRFYDAAVTRCVGHPWRETALYAVAVCIMIVGAFAAYKGWIYGQRPMGDFFAVRHFWFVRIAGLAFSGLILFAYSLFYKAHRLSPAESIKEQPTPLP